MRIRHISLLVAVLLFAATPSALANHAVGQLSNPVGAPLEGAPVVEAGNWDFIANFPAGAGEESSIGVDVEPYKKTIDGELHKFAIMSSTTLGFSIFDVTDPATPVRVADYGAHLCGVEAQIAQLIEVLASGQDFNATSSALGVVHGWEGDIQITPDGNIAILATDAAGRCHDPGWGGLELVDVSDPTAPSLLGLVRLQGESHNSTIDLDRPWINYNSNSDTGGNNFFDVVDFKSCLALDPATCLPKVSRFQFKNVWTVGTESPAPSASHDLTFMLHKLWCVCINSTMVFDPSDVYKGGKLSGTDMTDPDQVGEDNACQQIAPSEEAMVDVMVVDCSDWTVEKGKEVKLKNADIKLLSRIQHAGVNYDEDAPMRSEIQISHKADPLLGGKLMMVGDERGGGLNAPPGRCPGGGLWFYDMRDPKNPEVAVTPKGRKAVFRPTKERFVQAEGSNCTAHLAWEWPKAKRFVAMAWYSSGTQTFKYRADFSTHPATVQFYNRKSYVPPGASTWTSRVFDQKTAEDGSRILYFAATDIARGYDFFTLTLPPPRPPKTCKGTAGIAC